MFTILGTDDSINTCDCCGRSNLKHTVIVQTEDGEILHYGSVCATRHTKYSTKEIKGFLSEIQKREAEDYAQRKEIADIEFRQCAEYRELSAVRETARKMGLIGVKFMEFCYVQSIACRNKELELIAKYNLTKTVYLM